MGSELTVIESLKALFDIGGVVVVTFMLWIVWRRLQEMTDRIIEILWELRLNGAAQNKDDNEA